MFYLDPKNKSKSNKPNNTGKKSIPLGFSTVSNYLFDFVEINLKVLAQVQPFGESKPCKIQGINLGQVTYFPGNIQNTIQSNVFLIPPKKTIRFDGHLIPYQKPFIFYHIKTAYQSDMLFIPFDLMVSLAPTNRIYFTRGLFFEKILLECVDLWPVVGNENKPLTLDDIKDISSSDHIQTIA